MSNINLKLTKKLFSEKFYPYLFDYSHRFEIYRGSAGSGKSYFITQKLIVRACNEKIKILVCRKEGTTLRETCFSAFKEVLEQWKIIDVCKITTTPMKIVFPNGSEIVFMGLDDETKLLSLNGVGTIFVEEVYQVEKSIVEQLNLRMRGKTKNAQILMAFNPISKSSWLYDYCELNPPKNCLYLKSTFRDNPFLSQEYIDALMDMYRTNPLKAMVFCDGEWGVDPEGLVFTNWRQEEFDEMEIAKTCEHRCGADLGFRDASSLVSSYYDRFNKKIYVADSWIKTGQGYDDILRQIGRMELTKSKIVFDSADPMGIQFFKRNGIYAVPCTKGRDSVNARIEFLKMNEIILHPRCKDLIEEFENFSYIKDKRTGKHTNDMTHEWSHGIDGLGYAYSDLYTKGKLKFISASGLGF